MAQDWAGALQIAVVATAAAAVLVLLIGFTEGKRAASRAATPLLLLCWLVGSLQVVAVRYLPCVVLGFAIAGGALWVRSKKARHR